MKPNLSNYPSNQNQTELFNISLINKENRPLINTSSSFVESLTSFLDPNRTKKFSNTQVKFPKSTKVYPLLWIDCKMNKHSTTQTSSLNQANIDLKRIFEQVLSKSNKLPLQTSSHSNLSSKKFFSAKKSFEPCSSSKIYSQTDQSNQINDKDLLITSKFIETLSESQNSSQTKNVMLIHLKLFLNNKSLKNLTQDLIQLGSFMANDIIINFTEINTSNENTIHSLIQIFQQIIESRNKLSKKWIGTKRAHAIFGNLQNQRIGKGKKNVSFYQIKDLSKEKKIIQSFEKVKQKYLQSLDTIFGEQEEFSLKQFLRKYQIASKIVENQSRKSLHYSDHMFNCQNVRRASETIFRQENYSQERKIRSKFQEFYNLLVTDNKNCQLPLPEAIIKFKIQQVVRNQLKDVSNKSLIEKVSCQYEKKIMQKNQTLIEKVLLNSMAQYLSSIFSPNSQTSNQQRQILYLHPQKVTSQLRQFIHTMQQTHIFITQNQINKYVYPQMVFSYYKRLYEQYGKVKRFISGNKQKNSDIIEQLKGQVQRLKKEKEDMVRDVQIARYCQKETKNQVEKYRSEGIGLRDEIILWKDKYENCNRKLLDQVRVRNLLQQNVKNDSCLDKDEQKLKENKQKDDLDKLKFSILQQIISQSGNQQQTLTKSFENQLNVYKGQYKKLQSQLKEKVRMIDKKEQIHREKINQLQKQLFFLKSSSRPSFEVELENELWRQTARKEIETLYQKRLDIAKKQFEQKLQDYRRHIAQLQQIKEEKNSQVQSLNSLVYNYKKQLIQAEDKLNENQRKIHDQDKNILELTKIIQDKNIQFHAKTNDNVSLTQKIKQKNIKIQILEQDVLNLKTQLQHKESKNQLQHKESTNRSNNLSFVKFQKDFIKPLSHTKATGSSFSSSKLIVPIESTPQKRVSRIKTVLEINQNIELQKLIQQRRTIEKNKERFDHQESILQKIEHKLISAKSQINPNSKHHSITNSAKKLDQNTQILQRVLKQSNIINSSKSGFQTQPIQLKISNQCRRKLF